MHVCDIAPLRGARRASLPSVLWRSPCGQDLILLLEIWCCLRDMMGGRFRVNDVRKDVHDRYNERVGAAHAEPVFPFSADGLVSQTKGRVCSPILWRLVDYWVMPHDVPPTKDRVVQAQGASLTLQPGRSFDDWNVGYNSSER